MKDCEAIRVELPAYAGGKLAVSSLAPVHAHLESCANCRAELVELERLEALLSEALSPITPSVTFASRFANRLAAEVAGAGEDSPRRGWFGWLLGPWLIPVAATALVAAMLLQPWSANHSASVVPMPALSGGSNGAIASAKKPAPDFRVAESKAAPKAALAANPPAEVLQRPELFVDYAVIRDLDILDGDGGSHAG
jgi:anti-sigma factor RsiW